MIVYCQQIRKAFGDIPIIIGGLEASLRRFAHYDYWDDDVRPSILVDSGADLLTYGMGERQTVEIASRLANGIPVEKITDIPGTCYLTKPVNTPLGAKECPNFEQVRTKRKLTPRPVRFRLQSRMRCMAERLFNGMVLSCWFKIPYARFNTGRNGFCLFASLYADVSSEL